MRERESERLGLSNVIQVLGEHATETVGKPCALAFTQPRHDRGTLSLRAVSHNLPHQCSERLTVGSDLWMTRQRRG
jgi:hypothetical protein